MPSAPGSTEAADVCAKSCALSWQPSASDGGAPITEYVVERRTGAHWIALKQRATSGCRLEVNDLIEGNKYEFRAIAVNKMGASKPGTPCAPFTAKDPWGTYLIAYSR